MCLCMCVCACLCECVRLCVQLMLFGDVENDPLVKRKDVRLLKKLQIWIAAVTTLFMYCVFLPAWVVMDGAQVRCAW